VTVSDTTPSPSGSATAIGWCGDACLRVAFGGFTASEALLRVRLLHAWIGRNPPEGFVDATPAYATLLVRFDPHADWKRSEDRVRELVASLDESQPPSDSMIANRVVEIPVCYESAFAPDLESVATGSGLSTSDVIAMHAAAEYSVAFVGFTPGFPYLLGLPERLHSARLERPRVRVPAGSVGIAGGQTGIYPRETPGGWKLIGRTPLRMFDASKPQPSLLLSGDRVRFVAIDAQRFAALAEKVKAR
jgi:inhibitor of KinA